MNRMQFSWFFLDLLISQAIFKVINLKLEFFQSILILAIYTSFNSILKNFVIGPLVWPLGRCKRRASLRECTILLRKFMNIYGIYGPREKEIWEVLKGSSVGWMARLFGIGPLLASCLALDIYLKPLIIDFKCIPLLCVSCNTLSLSHNTF